jgi:hypothetical protein
MARHKGMRKLMCGAVAAATIAALVAAPSAAAWAASSAVTDQPQPGGTAPVVFAAPHGYEDWARPDTILLGRDGATVLHVTWDTWGGQGAEGRALLCRHIHRHHHWRWQCHPVRVHLDSPQWHGTPAGPEQAFEHLTIGNGQQQGQQQQPQRFVYNGNGWQAQPRS